jgi:N-acetylneuraminic acid mutarotase
MWRRSRECVAMTAVLALAASMAWAGALSNSEVAPGIVPPDGGGSGGQTEALWPGPDGFGYTGSSCTYSWVDISATGTPVMLGDDAYLGPFAIGFSFPFYGSSYSDLYIGSNGFISFGAGSTTLTDQCPLPNATTPNNLIALMWDDLDPGDTSDPVYYQSFATCPVGAGQCMVVTYNNYHHYQSTPPGPIAGTFQAILFDNGVVRLQYLDAGAEEGLNSTTGIEGNDAAADYGLTFACNTAATLSDNLCIEIGQQPGINLGPDDLTGVACPGESNAFDMTLFNNSGAAATFDLSYSITSGNATLTGPATITVGDGAIGSFTVDLTPNTGLPNGTPVTGSVGATGASYSDTSTVNVTVDDAVIGSWTGIANTPEGVRYHATAYHNGNIYQIGGETGWWTFIGTVRRYNIASNTWSSVAALPTAVYGAQAVTIGDNIYVIGGSQCTEDPGDGCSAGGFSNAVQILDAVGGTWSTDTTDPLPTPLAYPCVSTNGSRIFVAGGQTAAGPVSNTLYIYDPAAAAGSRWTSGATLTTARAYASCAAINGNVYVAGGWTGGTAYINSVEVYNIAGGTWSAGPAMPVAAAPFGGGDLGWFLVTFGSYVSWDATNGTTYTCVVETYALNTNTNTWAQVADLPRCLYGTDGVSDNAVFYDITGRTNEGGTWHMALENQLSNVCGPIPVELMTLTIE